MPASVVERVFSSIEKHWFGINQRKGMATNVGLNTLTRTWELEPGLSPLRAREGETLSQTAGWADTTVCPLSANSHGPGKLVVNKGVGVKWTPLIQ